jgi:hypothetical protein
LGCTTSQHIPFGYLHLLVQVHQGLCCVVWSLIAKEVDGVRAKGSGGITTVEVQTLLGAFLNLSLRSAHFTDVLFSCEKQNFRSWDDSLKCQIVRFSELKEFAVYYIIVGELRL